ncbi:MAG: Uncharacterized protein XD61_1587 [Thermococcus sp. 40_45]|nr:MAG: Uncharacterized protein XD61_1587 [Thermococcus sp. 40_45]
MNNKFNTSLYIAHVEAEKFPNLHNLRVSIFDTIKQKEDQLTPKGFVLYENEMNVSFYESYVGRIMVSYKVNFIPKDRIILLSFYPRSSTDSHDKDPKYWGKLNNLNIGKRVLEFTDVLGDVFEVAIEDYGVLKFKRIFYTNHIDISNWNVLLFDRIRYPLDQILKNWRTVYEHILDDAKKTKYIFVLFSSIPFSKEVDPKTKESGIKAIESLKQELQRLGEVHGPYNLLNFKYILEGYPKETKLIAIFIENDEVISSVYKNFKKYLDIKNIPSQFISINTVNQKFTYPKVKLNFLLETLSKIRDKKPISLEPTLSVSLIDGILCLSDVKDASKIPRQRLFGALFMYTLSNKYEEIHIYEDINYRISKGGHIVFELDSLSRLAEYVSLLGGLENLKIDIFLTRPWKEGDIQKFIEKLSEKGYDVNRVYYISTLRARSTDEAILNNPLKQNNVEYKIPNSFRSEINEFWHFYHILSEHVAVVRTSTQLRIYPTLFNIYLELV